MSDDTGEGEPERGTGGAPEAADAGNAALEAVTERVLERISPDDDERATMRAVAEELIARATAAATDRCPDADVVQVGSTARDTWIGGDRDIDVFVRFPPALDRETLETYGLDVGHETLPEGHEEYAEHPYVTGEYDGFDVDVVPCFRLEEATDIRSAVDRTPFHNRYLEARLDDETADDVRLAKQFLKAIGAYGSNLRTEGFSGYLTELLVVEYGGFRPLLEAVADWHPPVELDPEDHGRARETSSRNGADATFPFDDPLVVIDPTDPERNVAAVCSAANVARFQHYARELLESPRIDLFEPDETVPLETDELAAHIDRRETTPVAIRFDAPNLVDDQLYPQLQKSLDGVVSGLERREFDVLRAEAFADASAVLLVELTVAERPAVERHEGPPVHVRSHAEGFHDAYADDEAVYGPFIDGDRYVVERDREFTDAVSFLESDRLLDVGLGAHVETALEGEYEVLVGPDVSALLEEFGAGLRTYFEPTP
ncbi:CCA tRNA nucleotidyltransferase [Natronosalvus halobius]|uniref:CCA tRNA nucleotidyltransferase n=1 Tax=Natronosalvus halobius TaxID=2953746 RepID=UPI00209D878C|nr:CCA tRNA nucleotidyltransferase [Natronosalvus halobius]USZ70717.1 CCA tRNA nucleotidyltransferase [Natronosalvus halobius]